MPRPRALGPLATGLAGVLLLAGCASVDEDAVDAIGELPGIDHARSSCDLSDCTVSISTEADVTADELLAALDAARETDADTVDVGTEGAGSLEVDAGSDPDDEPAAVALVLDTAAGAEPLSIVLATGRTRVSTSTVDDESPWDLGEALWPEVEDFPVPTLSVGRGTQSTGGAARLVAEREFPSDEVALVRDLEGDASLGLTGAVVDGDGVLLGVPDVTTAEVLEARLADDPAADGLTVEVAVTSNVLSYRADEEGPRDDEGTDGRDGTGGPASDPEAGTEADRRALLTTLEGAPGAFARVEGATVVIDVDDLAAAAGVVDVLRATEPEAAGRVPLTVTQDGATVELGTTGSTALLRLAGALLADPTVEVLEMEADDPEDEADPPYDAEAFVRVELAAPDLATGVRTVAAAVGGVDGATSLVVGVTAVDPEGRTPGVTLRVDREGGTWVAEGVGGTDEQNELGVAAWDAGVAGARG